MVVQDIYIEDYRWSVRIFYAVSGYDVDEIMRALHSIGCTADYAAEAYSNLRRNALNSGLTFSNYRRRQSVVVVALSSSAKQFHRCLIHELRHLQSHIASADNIDEKSEQVCYLLDDIVGLVHETCAPMMCGCCRKKQEHNHETATQTVKRREYGARMPLPSKRRLLP